MHRHRPDRDDDGDATLATTAERRPGRQAPQRQRQRATSRPGPCPASRGWWPRSGRSPPGHAGPAWSRGARSPSNRSPVSSSAYSTRSRASPVAAGHRVPRLDGRILGLRRELPLARVRVEVAGVRRHARQQRADETSAASVAPAADRARSGPGGWGTAGAPLLLTAPRSRHRRRRHGPQRQGRARDPRVASRYASPTSRPAPARCACDRHLGPVRPDGGEAPAIASATAATTSSVYSASDPAPRVAGSVARPGPPPPSSAAADAADVAGQPAAQRRPRDDRRAAPATHVSTTAAVCGSPQQPADGAEQPRDQRREVQLGVAGTDEAIAVDERRARRDVGHLVGGEGTSSVSPIEARRASPTEHGSHHRPAVGPVGAAAARARRGVGPRGCRGRRRRAELAGRPCRRAPPPRDRTCRPDATERPMRRRRRPSAGQAASPMTTGRTPVIADVLSDVTVPWTLRSDRTIPVRRVRPRPRAARA